VSRATPAERAADECARQGKPERITDPEIARRIASVVVGAIQRTEAIASRPARADVFVAPGGRG
jgi:hypothetical protein